jgi:lysylphosphatidylglycerol synthetase-like protein (DUF2156 family)
MPTTEQNCFESDSRDRQLWQILGAAATVGLTDAQLRASPVPVLVSGTSLTPTATANILSGAIAAGCIQITFIASVDFVGTLLTNFPFTAGASLTITAPVGSTIGAIAFTRSAGTLYTVELR